MKIKLLRIVPVVILSVAFMALMPGDKPKPNEDFFMYANGDWIAANPIPPTESQWGSFNELRDKNRKLLHRILDSLSAITNAPKGSGAQLAGDFYASGLDSARIESLGFSPLKPELARIDNIKTSKDVMADLAHLQSIGVYPLFGIGVDQDAKKSDQYALTAGQGGLGLPNKGYYFKKDGKSDTLRQEYMSH